MGLILISQKDYKPVREIYPETMSVQLKERDSSASFTAGDIENVTIKSWLRDDTNPGKNIVWRVKSISQAFMTDTWTVQLEHVIGLLRDRIVWGKVTPATITGTKNATTCTAKQAVNYILGKQSDWVLGTMTGSLASKKNPYKFDGENLLDALEKVTDSLEGAVWSYDTSGYPFKLNITIPSSSVQSEMRVSRNLKTINKTIDKSGMFTRFYPIGKNDLHIKNSYVSKNASDYGVICKTETDSDIDTTAELERWAKEQLNKHAQPNVTIDVDGLELADATGESLDRFGIGRLCRVPLPEFGGSVIQERIAALNYTDKVNQPEAVRVTLSNTRKDVTKIIADAIKKAGGGSRSAARRDKEDNAWMADTDDHVAMCAKGIVGVDATGKPNWVILSKLVVDGTGIHSTVQELQKDVAGYETRIDQTEKDISLVVGVNKNGKYIKAGEICLAIDKTSGASKATISADHVMIGKETSTTVIKGKCKLSDVTADYIGGKIASLATVNVKYLSSERGGINVKTVACTTYTQGGVTCYVPHAIQALQIVAEGNNYKLQRKRFSEDDWKDVGTFSRATSLSGSWSGRKFTVTASPQGNTCSADMSVHRVGSQGGNYMDMYVATGNSSSGFDDHGDPYKVYLVTSGLTVSLKSANSTSSGTVYAQVTCTDPHSNSISVRQSVGYSSAKQFEAFYKGPNNTYVSLGTHYWYWSTKDLNTTQANKTLYYA